MNDDIWLSSRFEDDNVWRYEKMKLSEDIKKKLEILIEKKQNGIDEMDIAQRSYLEGSIDTLVWVLGNRRCRK